MSYQTEVTGIGAAYQTLDEWTPVTATGPPTETDLAGPDTKADPAAGITVERAGPVGPLLTDHVVTVAARVTPAVAR